MFLLPSGIMQKISLFALAAWLVVFGVVLARRVIIAYRRAIRIFNETQADDIGTYIEWLSIFTYWAVIFGVGCGLLTFREWITSLRLEYAKNILKEHPEINIQKLAESSGFLSRSNFIKLFSEKEGCTPAKWKKSNRE